MPIKRTYLDSCVLIAAFVGDHAAHEAAFAILNDPDREFLYSDFVRLETLPQATYNKRSTEVQFYEYYFSEATKIPVDSQECIDNALGLGCEYGLGAVDAIHAYAAIFGLADAFVTAEKTSKPLFRLKSRLNVIHVNSA